jgi:hypothetical protein
MDVFFCGNSFRHAVIDGRFLAYLRSGSTFDDFFCYSWELMGVPLHGPIILPKRNKTNAFFYHCARSAGEAGQHFNLCLFR